MELLEVGVMSAVITVVGGLLGFLMKGRFDEVNRRIDETRDGLNRRIDEMRDVLSRRIDETNGRVDELRDDVRGLRGDFTQLAFAVAGRKLPNTGG